MAAKTACRSCCFQQLKTMHDKDAARMQSFKDVPDDAVRSIRAPTLIVPGDQDIVTRMT